MASTNNTASSVKSNASATVEQNSRLLQLPGGKRNIPTCELFKRRDNLSRRTSNPYLQLHDGLQGIAQPQLSRALLPDDSENVVKHLDPNEIKISRLESSVTLDYASQRRRQDLGLTQTCRQLAAEYLPSYLKSLQKKLLLVSLEHLAAASKGQTRIDLPRGSS